MPKEKKPLIYAAQHGAAMIRHSQISNATRGTDLGEVVPEVHLSQHPFPQDYGTVFSAACQGDHAFGDDSARRVVAARESQFLANCVQRHRHCGDVVLVESSVSQEGNDGRHGTIRQTYGAEPAFSIGQAGRTAGARGFFRSRMSTLRMSRAKRAAAKLLTKDEARRLR